MDFIEVDLDLLAHRKPLAIRFQGAGTTARFNVQLWRLGPGIGGPRSVTPAPEHVRQEAEGAHVYVIPALDWRKFNRLALIITRLDPDENADPLGGYTITLE